MASWVQLFSTQLTSSPFPPLWPRDDRGVWPTLRTQCRRRGARRQRHTPRQPSQIHEFSQFHEVGGAIYFGARQTQKGDPRHSPPGEKEEKRQRTWCTTGVRNEHEFPPGEAEGRLLGSGFDRSSAEAVTTLGPTRLQDGPASSSAHSRTEAMLACFTSVVGLKGALHGASYGTSSTGERADYGGLPVPAARDENLP
jgi:hypothetical protein